MYHQVFEEALQSYSQKKRRPGYEFGFFTKLRHSFTEYPRLKQLHQSLRHATQAEQKLILINYFKSASTTFNNHSFSLYLLDSLSSYYRTENWQNFYPPEKSLRFYQGMLYRGIRVDKKELLKIFENGHEARRSSKWVDYYVSDATYNMGISTSKNDKAAESYASAVVSRGIREANEVIFIPGYLLKINYRGEGGVDILETLKLRSNKIGQWLGSNKAEVNVIGSIKAEDIVGAWPVTQKGRGDFIANPRYQAVYQNEKEATLAERLKRLFI